MDTAATSKKFSIWKTLGIIVLILIIGFAFLVFSGTDDYNKEADDVTAKATEILTQLKNNEIDEVYKNTHPGLTKITSKEDISNLLKALPILKTFANSKFTKVSHGNGDAEISGELLDKDNNPNPFTLDLKKDGEVWKLYAINLTLKEITAIEAGSTDATIGEEDKTAKIQKINVGESFDKTQIVQNQSSIPADAPIIYVSVITTQSVDKIAANVAFVHVATGDTVNLTQFLYKDEEKKDEDKKGFYFHPYYKFTKPTQGWPKGAMKIIATLSNGDTKETSLEVK